MPNPWDVGSTAASAATRMAGCSIEDWSGSELYTLEDAEARVSVGGSLNLFGLGAIVGAAAELLEGGELTFWSRAGAGRAAAGKAFG